MPRARQQNPLSPLPFGQSRPQYFSDSYHFTDAVASSSKTLLSYDAIEKTEKFHCAVAGLKIGNIDLVASSASPSRFAVNESRGLYLCFLYDGGADADVDGFHGFARADEVAFLSPEVQRSGETTNISMVQFSFTESGVLAVAEQMFGPQSFPTFKRALQRPRNIDLTGDNASIATFLKGVIRQIDQCNLDADFLKALGVDDVIHRAIAAMVARDEGLGFEEKSAFCNVNRAVREVVDYIDANIEKDITSTDLERVAGIGARALQYAFLKSYGCSPTQWLRGRRLEAARAILLKADKDARIADIILSVGWRNIGSFPAAYAERYGELPSHTLNRSPN